jgi:hypothetical protein
VFVKLVKLLPRIVLFSAFVALLPINKAHALCAIGDLVTSTVTPSGGSFNYAFVVSNPNCGSAPLNGFFLPYFSDAGISSIAAPAGWSVTIDTATDLFGLGAGTMNFVPANPLTLAPQTSVSGFSFLSSFGSVKGPYATTLTFAGVQYTNFGDPLIPGSPNTLKALGAVPEPSATVLLAIGLSILGFAFQRRLRA